MDKTDINKRLNDLVVEHRWLTARLMKIEHELDSTENSEIINMLNTKYHNYTELISLCELMSDTLRDIKSKDYYRDSYSGVETEMN